MRHRSLLPLSFVLAVLIAACGDSAGGGDPADGGLDGSPVVDGATDSGNPDATPDGDVPDGSDPDAGVGPVEAFDLGYRAVLRAQCESIFASVTWASRNLASPVAMAAFRLGSIDGCVEAFGDAIFPPGQRVATVEAIETGRVLFHSDKASACAEELDSGLRMFDFQGLTAQLQTLFIASPSCADLFTGTLEEGATCALELECGPNLTCTFPQNSCGGSCTATEVEERSVAVGASCTAHEDCVAGSACLGEPGSSTCRTVAHVADRQEGQSCLLLEPTTSSLTVHFCAPELGCASDGGDPVCTPRLAADAACTNQDACVEGFLCTDDPAPANTRSCRPITFGTGEGDPCSFGNGGNALVLCDSSKRLYCAEADNTCTSIGDGRTDSPCIATGEVTEEALLLPCDEGFYCQPITYVCAPLKATNEECVVAGECASSLCLEGACAEAYCAVVVE